MSKISYTDHLNKVKQQNQNKKISCTQCYHFTDLICKLHDSHYPTQGHTCPRFDEVVYIKVSKHGKQ